jgi:two-component system OmpR family response regulator
VSSVSAQRRILIVDDDNELRSHIAGYLAMHGYLVEEARDAPALDRAMGEGSFDLVVLDVMLPGEDGLSICRRLAAPAAPQIIMLSAMGDETDRIVGLEIGADDYLPKPCSPRELLARVRAVLRRSGEAQSGAEKVGAMVEFAGFRLDLVRRRLHAPNGSVLVISNNEFALLTTLLRNPGRVLSRQTLAQMAEIGRPEDVDRAVDMLVSRLRRKLQAQSGAEVIATVRGQGYRLVADTTADQGAAAFGSAPFGA